MKKMRSWSAIAVAFSIVAGGIAAGCGKEEKSTTAGDLNTITAGTLTVGSDIPYKPFEFGSPPGYDGFDIDVVNKVAAGLDLEVKYVKTPFDTIFRNLAQGKFDMVASASTITPERKRTVDFSAPYFPADQSLMVKKGSPIQNVSQLNGKVVGAQLGTTGADYAKKKTDAKQVRTYDVIDDAFKALEAGQVAAVINDFPVSKYAEKSHPNLVVVQTIPTGEEYGFAFNKKSTELRDAVNEQITKIKDDGSYTEIYKKWFGADPPKSFLEG